jgi:hypothetical protein
VKPSGSGKVAEAIAIGVSSVFGAGNALYRIGSGYPAQDADTVPFGCFRKVTWRALGGFNERLLSNEDYEFNTRVRRLGGRIHFDPRIVCEYFARPTLSALAKQYWRYGWWKAQMLKCAPTSLRTRQALPALWSLASFSMPLLGLIWGDLITASLTVWVFYLVVVCLFSLLLALGRGWRFFLPLLAVFPIIHFAWGSAFWVGLFAGQPAVGVPGKN